MKIVETETRIKEWNIHHNTTVDDWCCDKAKKELTVNLEDASVHLYKYKSSSSSYDFCTKYEKKKFRVKLFRVKLSYCPFCGSKIVVERKSIVEEG